MGVAAGPCGQPSAAGGLQLDRRRTFGFDLYQAGRSAALPLADGGTITAREDLEQAWACARLALAGHADQSDLVR